jgi:hypothetical protein
VNKRPIMFFSFPLSRQKILLNRKKWGKEKNCQKEWKKLCVLLFLFARFVTSSLYEQRPSLTYALKYLMILAEWAYWKEFFLKSSLWRTWLTSKEAISMYMTILWNFYNIKFSKYIIGAVKGECQSRRKKMSFINSKLFLITILAWNPSFLFSTRLLKS